MCIHDTVYECLQKAVKTEITRGDELKDKKLITLGMSSIQFIKLIVDLEMELDIEIDEKHLSVFQEITVAELDRIVRIYC